MCVYSIGATCVVNRRRHIDRKVRSVAFRSWIGLNILATTALSSVIDRLTGVSLSSMTESATAMTNQGETGWY